MHRHKYLVCLAYVFYGHFIQEELLRNRSEMDYGLQGLKMLAEKYEPDLTTCPYANAISKTGAKSGVQQVGVPNFTQHMFSLSHLFLLRTAFY